MIARPAPSEEIANPSFEKGRGGPAGWRLEGGKGDWIRKGGAAGRSAVAATGDGEDESYWRSDPLDLAPSTVYRLRFQARSLGGSGGTPISGPQFCNRDLGGVPGEWTSHTSIFVSPEEIAPENAWVRFGQWHVRGSVAFDDVSMHRAAPVYRRAGDVLLGEGERLTGTEYEFRAPFSSSSRNHSRPLDSHRCGFNTNRWVFGEGAEVIYRHRVGDRAQRRAAVEAAVTYHTGGELLVEASADGRAWTRLGTIDRQDQRRFEIPPRLLPTREILVRLRAAVRRAAGPGSDPGAFQVGSYTYSAEISGDSLDLAGETRFVAIPRGDPALNVRFQDLGDLKPGGRNVVALALENTAGRTLAVTARAAVRGEGGRPPVEPRKLRLPPGVTRVELPYEVPGPGDHELAISFGGDVAAEAESAFHVPEYHRADYGALLPGSGAGVSLWWASSGWKISPDRPLPSHRSETVLIRAARNEAEAAQFVVRPEKALLDVVVSVGDLTARDGGLLAGSSVDVLRVRYVPVATPTDESSVAAPWPDPLPPLVRPLDLAPGTNHPFWVRVRVPRDTPAGVYRGLISLKGPGTDLSVPLEVEVYDFALPDRMSCVTAFGFSPENVWKYQKVSDPEQRREVLEKYLRDFGEHRISPYDPVPLDPYVISWPQAGSWTGGHRDREVKKTGESSLLVEDRSDSSQPSAVSDRPVPIPPRGLDLGFCYRTREAGHRFIVALNHLDGSGRWMPGKNRNFTARGNGKWQEFRERIGEFPAGAAAVQIRLYASEWRDDGSPQGAVWFDDVSLRDAGTGEELLSGGGFEPVPAGALEPVVDWRAWDAAMERDYRRFGFNSFVVSVPGLGGGTFHARTDPSLLGYAEGTPEYRAAFRACAGAVESHLKERGLLGDAFVYWFDEPDPKDYEFVMNGFRKLKEAAPGIGRMLTEQPEPGLYGGPDIWCPVSPEYNHERAEERRGKGDRFWWYVCTYPQAPYAGLFIDHPGTEMRVWLWQTWKRGIEGILVWQTNYWTSDTAYPDPDRPQDPYADPMGWQSGYGLAAGTRQPWGNGDGRFIYPPEAAADGNPDGPVLDGPVSSIRWEMLRDGIEDYEYLAILRRLLGKHGRELPDEWREDFAHLLEVPESITRSLTDFTKDPSPIETRRHAIARAIEELSKL